MTYRHAKANTWGQGAEMATGYANLDRHQLDCAGLECREVLEGITDASLGLGLVEIIHDIKMHPWYLSREAGRTEVPSPFALERLHYLASEMKAYVEEMRLRRLKEL